MPTLNWIGKDKVINHHQDIPFRVLDCCYAHSEENSGNMMVKYLLLKTKRVDIRLLEKYICLKAELCKDFRAITAFERGGHRK